MAFDRQHERAEMARLLDVMAEAFPSPTVKWALVWADGEAHCLANTGPQRFHWVRDALARVEAREASTEVPAYGRRQQSDQLNDDVQAMDNLRKRLV